jgi:hypothetical protein
MQVPFVVKPPLADRYIVALQRRIEPRLSGC